MKYIFRAVGACLCLGLLLAALTACEVVPPQETPIPSQSPAPTPTATPVPSPPPDIEVTAPVEEEEFAQTSDKPLPQMEPLPWTELLDKPDAARMMDDIAYLCSLQRVYGGDDEKTAALWAAKRLDSLGFDVAKLRATGEGVEFPTRVGKSTFSADIYGPVDMEAGAARGSCNGIVEGVLKNVNGEKDLLDDMTGIIALVSPGAGDVRGLLHEAASRGAKGAVINTMDVKEPVDGPDFADGLVAVSVSQQDGVRLLTMIVQGNEVEARLEVQGSAWGFDTQNVIAKRRAQGGETADIIIVAAHLDCVYGASGATDNAVGVAAVLECARLLENFTGDVELRLILFGAEEGGALGARAYVSQMPEAERARVKGMLNLDMFASKLGTPGLIGGSKETDAMRNAILSAQKTRALTLIKNISFPKKETPLGDHIAFSEAGMPALLIAHKSVADEYHMPEDTPDKVSEEALVWVCETAAAWAASMIHPVS